jgi:hypothetical protein
MFQAAVSYALSKLLERAIPAPGFEERQAGREKTMDIASKKW